MPKEMYYGIVVMFNYRGCIVMDNSKGNSIRIIPNTDGRFKGKDDEV